MVSSAYWTSQLVVSLESMGWILIMLTDRSLLLVLLDHTLESVVHVVVGHVSLDDEFENAHERHRSFGGLGHILIIVDY